MDKDNTFCAFSGHRSLPAAAGEQLPRLLRQKIVSLAEEGYTGFLCGGAMGFDTLAAEAVISVRRRYPALTLTLALPCPEQDRAWPESARLLQDLTALGIRTKPFWSRRSITATA